MEQIRETLTVLLRNLEKKNKGRDGGAPEDCLKKALTKKELGHIKIKYFKQGVLGLNVDSSSWLYALSLKKEEILGSLKRENRSIKDISLRIGEV